MTNSTDWNADYCSGNFRHWEPDPLSPELATLIAVGSIKEKQKILDLGCGAGIDAILFAKYGFDVTALDVSRKALLAGKGRARRAQVRVDWVLGSVFDLPIEEESVDL